MFDPIFFNFLLFLCFNIFNYLLLYTHNLKKNNANYANLLKENCKQKIIIQSVIMCYISMGYFDWETNNGLCGVGMLLKIKRDHYIKLKLGVG